MRDPQLRDLLELAYSDTALARNSLVEIRNLEELAHLLTELCVGRGHSAEALLQAVCSSETSVEVLISVKSTAKRLTVAAESAAQKGAAIMLYHLAVASALGCYKQNISSKNAARRLRLYEEFAAKLSDNKMAAVFERAIETLRNATDTSVDNFAD